MSTAIPRQLERGFAMAELLVVVGIIGICATLAIPKVKNMIIIAQRAEAKTNLALAHSLVHSFRIEKGRTPLLYEMGNYSADVAFMTNGEATNCVNSNVVGFKMSTCKARYGYYYHPYPGPSNAFFVGAVSRTANHLCEEAGADWVLLFSNEYQCVLNDATATDCHEAPALHDPDCEARWMDGSWLMNATGTPI